MGKQTFLNRCFSKEDIQIANNRYEKILSIISHREMQIKPQ